MVTWAISLLQAPLFDFNNVGESSRQDLLFSQGPAVAGKSDGFDLHTTGGSLNNTACYVAKALFRETQSFADLGNDCHNQI